MDSRTIAVRVTTAIQRTATRPTTPRRTRMVRMAIRRLVPLATAIPGEIIPVTVIPTAPMAGTDTASGRTRTDRTDRGTNPQAVLTHHIPATA